MKEGTKILAVIAATGALALAACGGSSDISPVAPTTAEAGTDSGTVTASGYGPGASPSPLPGTGTCTPDCDGTGAGSAYGPGPANG